MNVTEKFFSKVVKPADPLDCWGWKDKAATFRIGTRTHSIGRASWFIHHGEFPELFVLHDCDNKYCGNPSHLYLGDAFDNAQDAKRRGRAIYFGLHHICCVSYTDDEISPSKPYLEEYRTPQGRVIELRKEGKVYAVSCWKKSKCEWVMWFKELSEAKKEFMSWR